MVQVKPLYLHVDFPKLQGAMSTEHGVRGAQCPWSIVPGQDCGD